MAIKKGKKKKKINFKRNLSLYWQLARPYKWWFLATTIIVLIMEVAILAEKFLLKVVIDEGTKFSSGNLAQDLFIGTLVVVALIYAISVLVSSLGRWYRIHLINRLDSSLILDLKKKFFNHIVHLDHRFHTTHKTGSLISKLTRGGSAIEGITDFFIMSFAPLILQTILIGGAFLYFDLNTAISIVIISIIFIVFSIYAINKKQVATLIANRAEDAEKGFISDIFTNIDTVKYFGRENAIKKRYLKAAEESKSTLVKSWDYFRVLEAGHIFIIGLGTFLIVLFPLLRVLEGSMTIGTLVFIYTAYGSLMGPLFSFVWNLRNFQDSLVDFETLSEYDELENEIEDKEDAPPLKVKEGEVEYKNVEFSYEKNKTINNVSIKIKPGEKIALVGHSGSGKTTLVKLLYRLYDVQKGKILIDGKDIRDVKQESLRGELAIVPQECILFDDTIYNNIAFSRPSASREEVIQAIKLSRLDKFIKSLPKKENTIVGERGVKLSGGERQRVSIARAILADKKILVLDEATSSLDSKTEYEIQKALEGLMKGRTSIIIAHRLSTIMGADKIIVVSKGRIVQVGKHRDLIKRRGIYKELWDLQKGGYLK